MNLVFVADVSIHRVYGGAERVLHEQSTRLVAGGHTAHLITRRRPDHPTERETIGGVAELRCDFDPNTGPLGVLNTWRQAHGYLRGLCRKSSIDCLNIHQPLTAFGLIRAAAALKIPCVYTCHSLSGQEYQSRNPNGGPVSRRVHAAVRHGIERLVLRCCSRIITLSRFTREKLRLAHGIPPSRVEVIPAGVDLDRFRPGDRVASRFELGIPPDRFVLLSVRNLVPRMGLDRLISAMQVVADRLPHSLLIIGGDGPLKSVLQAQIDRLELGGHVRLAGFIPETTLPGYYRAADLFILPSVDLEGFGMVTLEALACGLPVLGTAVGATPEILRRLNHRCVVMDGRPETMAQQILEWQRRLGDFPGEAAAVSRACRELVATHYSWERNIAAVSSVLERAGSHPDMAADPPACRR